MPRIQEVPGPRLERNVAAAEQCAATPGRVAWHHLNLYRPAHRSAYNRRACSLRETKTVDVKDSNGNLLAEGDTVTLIKDLKVKGSTVTLKRGTVIKNIRLTSDEEEIEGRTDKVKGLVLKACFVKKA
ncbi:MAG: hypothetical protein EPO08_09920 [Rhodospirillaceae bacterium]|nr:MAG: hypothetical protein EPO08_09920 [Rhodospirillaceae bacterium]